MHYKWFALDFLLVWLRRSYFSYSDLPSESLSYHVFSSLQNALMCQKAVSFSKPTFRFRMNSCQAINSSNLYSEQQCGCRAFDVHPHNIFFWHQITLSLKSSYLFHFRVTPQWRSSNPVSAPSFHCEADLKGSQLLLITYLWYSALQPLCILSTLNRLLECPHMSLSFYILSLLLLMAASMPMILCMYFSVNLLPTVYQYIPDLSRSFTLLDLSSKFHASLIPTWSIFNPAPWSSGCSVCAQRCVLSYILCDLCDLCDFHIFAEFYCFCSHACDIFPCIFITVHYCNGI